MINDVILLQQYFYGLDLHYGLDLTTSKLINMSFEGALEMTPFLNNEKYPETKNWPKPDVDCKLICQMKHLNTLLKCVQNS